VDQSEDADSRMASRRFATQMRHCGRGERRRFRNHPEAKAVVILVHGHGGPASGSHKGRVNGMRLEASA